MTSGPSNGWRKLFVVGGIFYFVGAFFHPRDGSMGEMLVNPAWVPAHAGVFAGFALITLGLLEFRRNASHSPTMRRWLGATIVLAVLQVIEMALHTLASVDADTLPPDAIHGGLSTPVLTAHLWLSTLAFTPFAIAFAGLIWIGSRERRLGSPWFLWLGLIGAAAYGSVMWLVFIVQVGWAGILFPVAHLTVPLWFILAGLLTPRQPEATTARVD